MDNEKKGYSDKLFFKQNAKSNLIKKMMDDSGLSQSDLADYLNCTLSSLRNKFTRDSFSLYDFIVICHVCGYSFSICNGDLDFCIGAANDCIESTISKINDGETDTLELLDDIEVAQEHLDQYECYFDFSPENILSNEEINRIKNLESEKKEKKYKKIIQGLSDSEQMTLFSLLKEKIEDSSSQ